MNSGLIIQLGSTPGLIPAGVNHYPLFTNTGSIFQHQVRADKRSETEDESLLRNLTTTQPAGTFTRLYLLPYQYRDSKR